MKVGAWWKKCELLLMKYVKCTNLIQLASVYMFPFYLIDCHIIWATANKL